jgi:type II secretory pathway pseudopilin PulG
MKSRNGGYTILEALIFLTVSGLLFALVYPSFASRDNSNKFSQSVNDMANKINDVINDVSTGYYPSADTRCIIVGSGAGSNINFNNGLPNSKQGTREDCIFVGKVVSFNINSPSINIETMVGMREVNGNGPSPTTIALSKPVAVDPSTSAPAPDVTEIYSSKWGVPVSRVGYLGPNPYNTLTTPSIGIMLNLGANNLSSSTKSLDLYRVNGNTVSNINDQARWSKNEKFVICMDDPNSNKVAGIIIDSKNGTKARAVFDNIVSEMGVANVCS